MSDLVDVLLTERAARDLARWDEMAATFTDDARVRVSWFAGTGAEFVAASRAMYEAGSRSFHDVGAVRVRANGDRAVADASAAVHVRGELGGVAVDVTTHGRLFWRLCHNGSWRIASLEMLYQKDTIAAVDPTRPVPATALTGAGSYRPSYRYLALLLAAGGREIAQDLPGADRPDLVDPFLTEWSAHVSPR
jgi:hypothetical protein